MHILWLCHSKINIHQLYENPPSHIFSTLLYHQSWLICILFPVHTLHRYSPNSFYSLVFNQQPFLMGIERPSFPCHCKGCASTLFVLQSFSLSTFDIWGQKILCCGCFSGQTRVVRTSTLSIQKLHWCDNQKISSRCLLGSKINLPPQKKKNREEIHTSHVYKAYPFALEQAQALPHLENVIAGGKKAKERLCF